MSEEIYLMYCTGFKYELHAKAKQINVKLHGILLPVCIDLAYKLHFKPVQDMMWYTSNGVPIYI